MLEPQNGKIGLTTCRKPFFCLRTVLGRSGLLQSAHMHVIFGQQCTTKTELNKPGMVKKSSWYAICARIHACTPSRLLQKVH